MFLSIVAIGLGVIAWNSPVALADAKDEICKGVGASTNSGCTDTSGSLQRVINAGINIFSVIIGIVAVIMIMVGGLKYITAAGDSGKVSSAKSTILYAIVGLVVVALAQIIVSFVLQTSTS